MRDSLQALDLSFCQNLESEDLKKIATLPALRALSLRYCQWLNDTDLLHLAPPRGQLERLNLSLNKQLTSACVEHLYGFEKLLHLDLTSSGVDQTTLEALQSRLPRLKLSSGNKGRQAGIAPRKGG